MPVIGSQSCDMHLHTMYSHDCVTPMPVIKAIARKYELMLAITDHNRIGGSLAAKGMGIPVIPAIEVTTKALKDIIVYFHDFDNLQDFFDTTVKPALNPGRLWSTRTSITETELLDAVGTYDAFTSLCHPYCPVPKRSASLPMPTLRRIDGIEVMNFAMSKKANQKAAELRDKLDKPFTAGSDSHHPTTIGMTVMRGHSENPSEFLTEVRQGLGAVVGVQRKRRDLLQTAIHHIQARQRFKGM